MIESVGPKLPDARDGRPADHYGALVRAIVGQQLSTKAARSIFLRLTERFDGRTPTPQEVLADEPEALRAAAGLSRAKVSYLRSLAEHALSGELELERLDDQEFVVAFDTDDVGTFLDLVQRLRTTEASRYTVRDTPSFTCLAVSLPRALNALDGEPVSFEGASAV